MVNCDFKKGVKEFLYITLRGTAPPNPKLACFVLYLKLNQPSWNII